MPRALVLLAAVFVSVSALQAQSPEDQVGGVFARWDLPTSPGCAVGVDRADEPLLRQAYGMADLEWGIPNTAETIFENGSVSKQFTAAAIVLLVLDGTLSLEDDVRQYVPELPDYPETITLRHLLNHTSGLRDWGAVAALSGWGRPLRTHTQEHVIQILSRQSALNFPPGHEYSYSNSGYNLLAIIVGRVSGMSFAEFSQARIFGPLGMSATQWRDDYTRIVPGRSAAYTANRDGSFSINRPIEDVHGNGGLLTTVGDLLLWNRSLDEASIAGPEFVEMMETQGVLNDGRTIDYALGLTVTEAFGQRVVLHGGATSGYRAGLIRFPDPDLSVAILCNVTNANAIGLAMDVAELYLEDRVADNGEPAWPSGHELSSDALTVRTGRYVSTVRPAHASLEVDEEGRLRLGGANGTVLIPRSSMEFEMGRDDGARVLFDGAAADGRTGFTIRFEDTLIDAFVPAGEWEPTAEELEDFVGLYESDDAQIALRVSIEDGELVFEHPVWGQAPALRPLHQDIFGLGPSILRFRRLTGGQVHEMSWAQGRVYDMRFRRTH